VKLVRLSAAIEPAVRELAAEYEAEGIERFEAILQDYAGAVRAAGAPEIHAGVPLLVGTIRVRHELTEGLWQDGGNVGYEVRPSLWNRGYATRMLALALTEARRIGLDWVLLTVAPTNAASIRVIEKNGGARIGVGDRSGYLQYRIESCEAP
jgi:predicted acetyltransferase